MGIMKMDMINKKEALYLVLASFTWIMICLIIGLTGPKVWESDTYYAYDCPENSHTFNEDTCDGVQMNKGQIWAQDFGEIKYINRIWILTMRPYSYPYEQDDDDEKIDEDLKIEVRLAASDSSDGGWETIDGPTESKQNLKCGKGDQKCDRFQLINTEVLEYRYYKVDIRLLNNSGRPYVGDVEFRYWKGSPEYAIMEIIFRIIYLIFSGTLGYLFLSALQKLEQEIEFEQRTLAMIMLALILYNNPLFVFEFNKIGWAFRFIGTLFEVLFTCVLMLYWLFLVDKIRLDQVRIEYSREHLPKLIVVAMYGVLSLALYGWIRVELVDDPVFTDSGVPTGVLVLFYLVAINYCVIVIWLVVLVILAVPVVWSKGYLFNRFNFTGIPTCLCIFSVIVGLFSGTIGPVGRTSVGFMYFYALYNAYCGVLCFGYWPHADTYRTLNDDIVPGDGEGTVVTSPDPERQEIRPENPTWYNDEIAEKEL